MNAFTPFWAITVAELKMLLRNKQSMFFTWIFPLALMLTIGFLTETGGNNSIDIGLVSAPTEQVSAETESVYQLLTGAFDQSEAITYEQQERSVALEALERGDHDIVLEPVANTREVNLFSNMQDPATAAIAQSVVEQIGLRATLQQQQIEPLVTFVPVEIDAQGERYVEFLVPGIIAMTIMQLGIFGTSFALVNNREKGILRRVMATPAKSWQFVLGNMAARLVISFFQTAILIVVAVVAFDIQFQQWGLLVLLALLGNVIFLALGLFVSGLAKTVETVPILSNLFVFPMLLVGGIFFSTDAFPTWLKAIVDHLPVAPLAELLRNTVSAEFSIAQLWSRWLALLVWVVITVVLAAKFFKMQEKD